MTTPAQKKMIASMNKVAAGNLRKNAPVQKNTPRSKPVVKGPGRANLLKKGK